jgi:arabinoxylan arabinofuranohydrolase
MSDTGPAAIAHRDPFQRQEAATICFSKGVKATARAQNQKGVHVTVREKDAYIKVAGLDFGSKGTAKFLASVAATAAGGAIEVRLDSLTGDMLGTLKINPTGAMHTWETQSTSVSGARGIHDLYLKFTGEGTGALMNVDWWQFE